ncbi:hypothetical protein F3Y22_tig00110053pilonHSYRG00178 [Hibiscus syriacus]|uniref:Protein kinase domain-containing protein n=1 Tax=Hibiscus syriacus TaxID=106335 RepID=A0A6A3BPQ0_HIBSY|nr:hypothetical protein F3Y22_tig00110053pilonHSYRG00178 [Hibiscus syriacus]
MLNTSRSGSPSTRRRRLLGWLTETSPSMERVLKFLFFEMVPLSSQMSMAPLPGRPTPEPQTSGRGSYGTEYFNLLFDTDNALRLIHDGPDISNVYWPNVDFYAFGNGRTNFNSTRIAMLDDKGRFSSSDRIMDHHMGSCYVTLLSAWTLWKEWDVFIHQNRNVHALLGMRWPIQVIGTKVAGLSSVESVLYSPPSRGRKMLKVELFNGYTSPNFPGWWFLFRKHGISSTMKERYRLLSNKFRKFSYMELKKATKNFVEEMGSGASGVVFKGVLEDERVVAVKKLGDSYLTEEVFWEEVNIIGKINHMNLKERFKIALGTAKGLVYLHHECLEWVIHCDVKSENILLNGDFEPKISDFDQTSEAVSTGS